MKSFLKDAFSLGLGALVVTKEKVEDVVNELVKKGEIGQEEGKKLAGELIDKGKKSKKEIEATIEKIVKGSIEKVNIPTRKELEELKSQIRELRKDLKNRN